MAEEKMYVSQGKEKGTVKISEGVLLAIVSRAALEQEGVRSLGRPGKAQKGIRLSMTQEGIVVYLDIVVSFDCVIFQTVKKIQTSIASAVLSMTGLSVSAVNVCVTGIDHRG